MLLSKMLTDGDTLMLLFRMLTDDDTLMLLSRVLTDDDTLILLSKMLTVDDTLMLLDQIMDHELNHLLCHLLDHSLWTKSFVYLLLSIYCPSILSIYFFYQYCPSILSIYISICSIVCYICNDISLQMYRVINKEGYKVLGYKTIKNVILMLAKSS